MRQALRLAVITAVMASAAARSQTGPASYLIETIAGMYPLGDGGPGATALLFAPNGLAAGPAGYLYIADTNHQRVRRVSPSGDIQTWAGTGLAGFSGDTGPGVAARLNGPTGLAIDAAGSLYIADTSNHRVRKVNPEGVIVTVAGNGTAGYGGDGGPATEASLNTPRGLALDGAGSLYIADSGNHRLRRVTPEGVILTLAGAGVGGYSGDGVPGVAARLNSPYGVALDPAGNVYIADRLNRRVRRVSAVDGVITTVAGAGIAGYSGDGGPAAAARLISPVAVAIDVLGSLYVADSDNHRIRKVAGGLISTVTGSGTFGFSGDGGPVSEARLDTPTALAFDPAGNLHVADAGNHRVRRIATGGLIVTWAGSSHFRGEGAAASSALLFGPRGVATANGDVYTADTDNHRVRKVSAAGLITTVAGTGTRGFSGDGGPAVGAQLSSPAAVALDAAGNLYIADSGNSRIRLVTPAGIIRTVAGDVEPLNNPRALAIDSAGHLYIADTFNHQVRVLPVSGGLRWVAGTGEAGYGGDGQLAVSAQLNQPYGLAVDAGGNLYISDSGNHRVRQVSPGGVIRTVAGTGVPGFSGDGGPAAAAQLSSPRGLAIGPAGEIYIADADNRRLRVVTAGGVIRTVAGSGRAGFSGDGGPARVAELNFSVAGGAVALAGADLVLADQMNHRVRRLLPLVAERLEIAGGNGQTGAPGTRLPLPLVARAVGPRGLGVPGVTVSFTVTAGAAVLSTTSAITGEDGSAGVEVTLGAVAGFVSVTASAGNLSPVRFSITTGAPPGLGPDESPRITAGGIVGAGLSSPPVRQLAPNGLATLFGEHFFPPGAQRLVSQLDLVDGRLPTNLGGVCLQVGPRLAPLLHVFSGQLNFQVPLLAPAAEVPVQVILNCGQRDEFKSNVARVAIAAAAPEFFYFLRNPEGGNPIAAVHASRGDFAGRPDLVPGVGFRPARPGDVISLFGTGFGATSPAFGAGELPDRAAAVVERPRVTLGAVSLAEEDMLYAGVTPGLAGVYQLNIRIPAQTPAGDLPVTLWIGSASTPRGGFLAVRR